MTATDCFIDSEESVWKRISWRFNSEENVMGFPLVDPSGHYQFTVTLCRNINLKTTALSPKVICFRSQRLITLLWVLEKKMAKGRNRTKQRKYSNCIQRTAVSNECEVRAHRATCEQKSKVTFPDWGHVPHPNSEHTLETLRDLQLMVTIRLLPPQEYRDCIHVAIEQYRL